MTTDVRTSGLDTVKLSVALLVLVGGIGAFYLFADQELWVRTIALFVAVAVAVGTASVTALGRSIWSFFGETRTEVRKVVWPTRAETVQTTLAVMFLVVLMGFILWGLDAILFWLIRLLTGQGG